MIKFQSSWVLYLSLNNLRRCGLFIEHIIAQIRKLYYMARLGIEPNIVSRIERTEYALLVPALSPDLLDSQQESPSG